MKFNFDQPVDRHGTGCCEWDATDEYFQFWGMGDKVPENAICLSTADMDFHCPPCVKEALHKLVDQNLYGYFSADPTIAKDYVNAVAGWYKKRYNFEIDPKEVMYVNGTCNALEITVKALTEKGDGVLITPPVYYPFYSIIEGAERTVVSSHLVETDMYYTINWEDFEAKAALESTKMCIFCSPHNPSGRVWKEEELKKVYDICTKHNVILVCDELHGDLVRTNQKFVSALSVADEKNNLVICSGANKTFNIAGLQASHMLTLNHEYKEKLFPAASNIFPNPFPIHAVTAAYNEGEEWLEELKAYLDGNLEFAVNFLKENMPEVKAVVPEGTYIIWMDFRGYGLSDEEIHDRIWEKAAVIYEDGMLFDHDNGQGFVRLCLGTQRAVIKEALERIAEQFK